MLNGLAIPILRISGVCKRIPILLLFLQLINAPGFSQQTLHYEETFTSNTNGWAVWDNQWNSARFEKGQYVYEMKGNYSHQTWNNQIRFDASRDFAIETSFKLLSGKPGESSYWLEWGIANGGSDYIAFGIYSDGTFQFGRAVNTSWKAITPKPLTSPAILAGINQTNVIRVERTGQSMIFRINGTEVYRTAFENFSGNTSTGFQANGTQRVAVDYLRIYQDRPLNDRPANSVTAADLYPVIKRISKDIDFKDAYLFTGCADGNCDNGTGTYMEVYCDRWDENRGKLQYKLYKGSFRNDGRYFNGTICYKEFLISRKNARKDFEPENGAVSFLFPENNCTTGEIAEMLLSPLTDPLTGVRNYIKNGWTNQVWVQAKHAFAKAYYHNGEPVYMYMKGKDSSEFWGLVNHNFEKVAGYEKRADGTVYTGGFYNEYYFGPGRRIQKGKTDEGIWNRGGLIAAQPVYIPDTGLIKKAVLELAGNLPFTILLDPVNVDEYNENVLRGRFYSESGEEITGIANGNGLVMGIDHDIYFGHFKNGKADGIGCYATPRWGETNYARSTNVYSGYFEQGKFQVGPVVHKTRKVEIAKDIMGLISSIAQDPNFQDERMMIRNGNYAGTLSSLRAKAKKGIPNAVYHINKFNELFTNRDDFFVNKPTTPELDKIMTDYFNGNAVAAVKVLTAAADKGDAEAMYYLAGFYEKGIGTTMHVGRSDELYRQALKGGYIRAAMPLARKYQGSFESLLRYGVNFNVEQDDSAMKYYLAVAQSQPSSFISPAEIQEARIGYYQTKYPGLRNSIGINIQLGDDENSNTSFGQLIASDRANKQRQQQLAAALQAGKEKTSGKYFMHIPTHRIIYVQPSAESSYMMTVIYMHYDPSKNFTAGVSVNELLNPKYYEEVNIKHARACNACKGEGVIRKSYKTTVADYEYTLGVKVVQSGTNSSNCLVCGGGGVQVN